MELEWSKTPAFLRLPREIRDQIYSYIIPTDKLFIFLLVEDNPISCAFDHFTFDRGYAFPLFDTSIFRVCHLTYAEAEEGWLKKSHFRLEVGENLGPRHPRWLISDTFISRMAHCDLTITLPFWPWWRERRGNAELTGGNLIMHRYLRRIFEAVGKGHSLRQTQIKIRNRTNHQDYIINSNHMPVPLLKNFGTHIMLPLKYFPSFHNVTIQRDVACLYWLSEPGCISSVASDQKPFHPFNESSKSSCNAGALEHPQSGNELPQSGKVYDVQVNWDNKLISKVTILTTIRLFKAYFDGVSWYLWVQ